MSYSSRDPRLATLAFAAVALVACAGASTAGTTSSAAGGAASQATAARVAGVASAYSAPDTMAAPGDTLWLGLNYIRPERRREYEAALSAFWGGGLKLGAGDPMALKAFRYTRVLYPVKPEADGTYLYVFLADPMIKGAPYDIPALLRRMYPAARADSIWAVMTSAEARPQQVTVLTQGRLNR